MTIIDRTNELFGLLQDVSHKEKADLHGGLRNRRKKDRIAIEDRTSPLPERTSRSSANDTGHATPPVSFIEMATSVVRDFHSYEYAFVLCSMQRFARHKV